MRLLSRILSYLEPSELQDLRVDELLSALIDPGLRKHWLWSVIEEMKQINRRTHIALMEGRLDERFIQESAKLQGIDFVLRQILMSKNSMALERHHNQGPDDPNVAVLPAP